MRALREEKATRNPRQMKMDSQLIYAAKKKRYGVAHRSVPELRVAVEFGPDGRAKVDIDATSPKRSLQQSGRPAARLSTAC